MNPYARAHDRTIELTLANMQRTCQDYKQARAVKLERVKPPNKIRKNRPYKRWGGWFAVYKRKYGLYVDDIAFLLKITHGEVHDLERRGTLKHHIKLKKLKNKS